MTRQFVAEHFGDDASIAAAKVAAIRACLHRGAEKGDYAGD